MKKYGFHEDDIDLFRSYLSNRKQIVKCHNEIYVNGIMLYNSRAACNLHADDTVGYCSANNVDTLRVCTNNYTGMDITCVYTSFYGFIPEWT